MVTRYMFIKTAYSLYPFPTSAIDAVLYGYFQEQGDRESFDLADLSRLSGAIRAAAQRVDTAPGPIIDPEIWFPEHGAWDGRIGRNRLVALTQRYHSRALAEAYIRHTGKVTFTVEDLRIMESIQDATPRPHTVDAFLAIAQALYPMSTSKTDT